MYRHLMKRATTCGLLAIALGLMTGAAYSAPFWVSKPYTEWSEKEVEKILGDSPWMRSADVSFDSSAMQGRGRMGGPGGGMGGPGGGMGGPGGGMGGPGGGMGGPGGGMGGSGGGMGRPDVYVMWQSAVPIRKAMARAAALKQNPAATDLERQIYETTEHHVLAVMGLPGGPGGMRMGAGPGGPNASQQGPGGQAPSPEAQQEMRERMQAQMLQSTSLNVDGTKVQPEKVETVISGNERVLLFYFPKNVALNAKTKSATFETSMGPLKISARFKPKDMLF